MIRLPIVIIAAASSLLFASAPLPGPVTQEVAAVVGRPLTPVSYAGVARRPTRRAVYATAATRPPVPAPVYW